MVAQGWEAYAPVQPVEIKPDFAKAQIAALAPQPAAVISVGKARRAMVVGIIAGVLWEGASAALPFLTPDVLEAVVAKAVAAYPALVVVKGFLFVFLLGLVKGIQNYLQTRAEAMKLNRAAPGVEVVAVPPPAILVRQEKQEQEKQENS